MMAENKNIKKQQPFYRRMWVLGRRRRPIVPSGPVPLILDNFTDTNGTAITAHVISPTNTPATSWTNSANTHTIQSNAAKPGTNLAFNIATCNPGIADGIFAVKIYGTDDLYNAGVICRFSDSNNHWFLSRADSGGEKRVFLYRVQSGSYNVEAQSNIEWVAGTEYALIVNGTSVTGWVDAIQRVSATSSFNQTETKAGIATVSTSQLADTFAVATTAGVPNSVLTQFCFCGDSLTSGAAVACLPYPNQTLGQIYSSPILYARGTNLGIVGQRASLIETAQGANADSTYNATYKKNVLVLWIGTNDLDDGATAATVEGYSSAFCTARRATGYNKIVVCNITPRNDVSWSAANETQRLALNALIASGYSAYADAYVDLAATPGLTDPSDAAIYPDGLHLSTAGNTLAAGAVKTVLNTLL